ncbi:MAG TPA: ADP-ribosylglycohydrolase family protein [Candidatus Krumholzibacterium sp.]|nr:ADP-ribosylglycohydrolase family protein [Candidatus Krumholzibacterium sp.]
MKLNDRIRGIVYGQAIGDALGLGTEFLTKAEVKEYYPRGLTDYDLIIQDRHRKRWKEGAWTDDTDQMLCILDSLLEKGGVDVQDIATRLYRWVASGGKGVGETVYSVISSPGFLEDPHSVAESVWERSGRESAANGGIMRTSILGIWRFQDPQTVRENASAVCKITHFDPRCEGSCVTYCLTLSSLLNDWHDDQRLIEAAYDIARSYDPRITEYLDKAQDSLEALQLDEGLDNSAQSLGCIGYTLKALGSAFWALKHAASFEDGLLSIIHEGGDADSNGAVAGAMLGARFGFSEIPPRLVSNLRDRKKLDSRIGRLLEAVRE